MPGLQLDIKDLRWAKEDSKCWTGKQLRKTKGWGQQERARNLSVQGSNPSQEVMLSKILPFTNGRVEISAQHPQYFGNIGNDAS